MPSKIEQKMLWQKTRASNNRNRNKKKKRKKEKENQMPSNALPFAAMLRASVTNCHELLASAAERAN